MDLARWVGLDGCHALFTRARAEARDDYPLLETIHLRTRSSPYLEGVEETVAEHGTRRTATALESMIVIVMELLGRLIGDDMTKRLIERDLAESEDDDATRDTKREAEA
jgi:hypothetical protein